MAKILLMGDSLVGYMPKGLIGKENDEVINKGIENIGVKTYSKYCWPRFEYKDIDVYVLLIGINNILRPDCDYDDEQTIEDLIDKLVEFIDVIVKEKNSKLIVQGLYPTDDNEINKKVLFVNSQISKYCKENNIEFLDMYDMLSNEAGLLKEEYSMDGLHPNIVGYNKIAERINSKIGTLNKGKR